jgi:Lon protease-like protein
MPNPSQTSDGPTIRPFAEPLRLAAIELAELARAGDQLQRVIVRLAAGAGALDAELMEEAQGADLLSQRLEGMAAFLRALADAVPAGAAIDVRVAMIDLTLAEQARRLAGPPGSAPTATDEASGDLLLFGS